jgi:thymidine kinase
MVGRLEVITGPMFAGKTEELLRRVERARIARKNAVLFKPKLDTRYASDRVVTHNGQSLPCYILPTSISPSTFPQCVPQGLLENVDVVAFDEAQFFGQEFPATL